MAASFPRATILNPQQEAVEFIIARRNKDGSISSYTYVPAGNVGNLSAILESKRANVRAKAEDLRTRWDEQKYVEVFDLSIDEDNNPDSLFVCSWDKFEQLQEHAYITDAKEISAEEYNEMLEVLPPLRWGNNNGIDSFFMSEFYTGRITEQYGKRLGKFYAKRVHFDKPETWLSVESIEALEK